MRSGGGMAPQVMKLYVVFSSLEIFDKLCSSFGQDILEAPHRHRHSCPTVTRIIAFIAHRYQKHSHTTHTT